MLTTNSHPILTAICLAIFLSPICIAQQTPDNQPAPKKPLTPEQQAYRQWTEKHSSLQAQGKQIFSAEIAREQVGDCKDANTTADFDNCYGDQLTITDQNLTRFEAVIRALQAGPPQDPAEATAQTPASGQQLSPQQLAHEFDNVEQLWRQYRDTACKAAFHQFDGGSGAASFEMQCELKLTRDHMRELDTIYGVDLHL